MASISVPCPKCSAFASSGSRQQNLQQQHSKVSFPLTSHRRNSLISESSLEQPLFRLSQGAKHNHSTVWKAQVNEVAVEKCSNSTSATPTDFKASSSDVKGVDPTKEPEQPGVPESSISAFMSEVASLVRLVDSRDIMELQLKKQDCELIIRKKEALPQAATAPIVMMQPHSAPMFPSQLPPVPAAASAPTSSAPPALPAPVKSSKSSSHPPLKCPMAGTFYQCPGPGEPPYVKVGDKVQKGQVICIIEAMKLMNEIEADQSGTVVEVIAEDGKPVSVDTPLFVIEP